MIEDLDVGDMVVFKDGFEGVIDYIEQKQLVGILIDYHLNTGFLATPFILDVLADGGAVDAAYALLEQESSPSWLYNVKNGATTILEEWNGMVTHAGSFNHYSYGAVCNFLFTKTAGIQPVLSDPGYKKFVIRPVIGGSLNWAKSCFESQYGTIRSEWSREK